MTRMRSQGLPSLPDSSHLLHWPLHQPGGFPGTRPHCQLSVFLICPPEPGSPFHRLESTCSEGRAAECPSQAQSPDSLPGWREKPSDISGEFGIGTLHWSVSLGEGLCSGPLFPLSFFPSFLVILFYFLLFGGTGV